MVNILTFKDACLKFVLRQTSYRDKVNALFFKITFDFSIGSADQQKLTVRNKRYCALEIIKYAAVIQVSIFNNNKRAATISSMKRMQ